MCALGHKMQMTVQHLCDNFDGQSHIDAESKTTCPAVTFTLGNASRWLHSSTTWDEPLYT